MLEPVTLGDPERVSVRWTSKSASKLAEELRGKGYESVDRTVLRLLGRMGFSMQGNYTTREGSDHPDRDAQFRYINETVVGALEAGQPVVSVDTKKKELVGEFKNSGREWAPKGQPVEVNTHDFPSNARGKATPYGVYDIGCNEGWISDGISSGLCEQFGIPIRVLHYPPGTSKCNRIEHRLFSFVSINWRGKPLSSYKAIINLISATTTSTGLKVYARLDESEYPTKTRSPTPSSPPSTSNGTRSTETGTTPCTPRHKMARL